MIDTKALRQKILDMAIRGKLVPQDPNDESASVLLERIREEKQRLIKEGKIKKNKNDSVIFKGDDNRYYENLPCGWKICSISDIAYLRTGATFDKANVLPSNKNAGIRVLRGGNISTYKIDFRADDIFIPTAIVNPAIHVQQYDIITPAVTSLENIGKMARIHTKPTSNYTVGGFVYLLTPLFYNDTFSKFLLYQFTSTWFIRQLQEIAKKSGAAFYNINKTKFNGLPVYIPPLAEQARIVKRIEELLAQIDIIEQNQADIDTLYEEFKKRTLTLAIQGKLVPQDPNDEPASVLLERIRAEKKAKLGKKYVDSYIYKGDDNCYYEHIAGRVQDEQVEVPFNIPDNWTWVRWGNLSFSIQYGYNAPAKESGRIKMVRISDIHNNEVDWENVPFCNINESDVKTYLLKENDILFARTGGTVGKSYLVTSVPEEAIYAGYLIRTQYSNQLSAQYLKYFMESSLYWMQLKNGTVATAQPNCNGQTLSKMVLPLPPLAEQKRIVTKINEIFAML